MNNLNKKFNKEPKKCEYCNNIMNYDSCGKKEWDQKKFCNRECFRNWMNTDIGKKEMKNRNKLRTYIKGVHNSPGTEFKYGKKHIMWVGGIRTTYQFRARKLMEKELGRKLIKGETIHHIDGNYKNNVIENLKLYKNTAQHSKYHDKFRMKDEKGRYL